MNHFKFTINGNKYDVEIIKIDDQLATLEVNGTPYEVEVHRKIEKTKTPKLVRKVIPRHVENIERKEAGSNIPVKAPLPGTIMEINVKPGDIVTKGQQVLMMEAMKMENMVNAERDGVVESIKVSVGDTVLQGGKKNL
jgi:biotin carboxyl carrier protein